MADLTIRFKGQPVLEMTESGTKTLKTAGKYCDGDIIVEYAKPAGGGGSELVLSKKRLPAVTTCTDVIANHIVVSSWSPSATAEEHIPKMYYYNGVLLPEIPADVLAQYPYCLMYENSSNGNMQLLLGKGKWYIAPSTDANYENQLWCSVNSDLQWYYCNLNSGTYWKFYKTTTGWWGDVVIKWSNHDIPNGSATATEIYFEGSEPVLAE